MKNFKFYLLLIALAEVASFIGWFIPEVRIAGFFVVAIVALLFAVERIEYGLLFLFAELFIGSKGYLFSYEYEGALFSIRIALFLVVMSAWFGKVVLDWIDISKAPKIELEPWMKKGKDFVQQDLWHVHEKISKQAKEFPEKARQKKTVYFYFGLLFLAIIWGLVNGVWQGNSFSNIFYDFNAWFYFAIIFPFAYILKNYSQKRFESFLKKLFIVFSACVTWLSVKTLALFYIFSHDFTRGTTSIYRWVRDTRIGEITSTGGGFSRIFIQSQVYVGIGLILFIGLSFYGVLKWKDNKTARQLDIKKIFFYYLQIVLCTAVILVSLSRSFWVGLAMALLFFYFFVILLFYKQWKKIILWILLTIVAGVLGFVLVVGIVIFPYPEAGIFSASIFKDRVSEISGEAAASSRWNLLPVLVSDIKNYPIRGRGFGAEVTYTTQDPRILEKNPTGEYTTYAFEWGWLDIAIKLGLLGALIYIILIIKIFVDGFIRIKKSEFRIKKLTTIALLSGLVMLVTTSMFSPYLNHPLGIGYLVLVATIFKK